MGTKAKEHSSVKHGGQVFTPGYLVKLILDEAGYCGPDILRKHCIDNSCGDGAFLLEIVRRYVSEYETAHGTLAGVEAELAEFIHGIEIDKNAYTDCLTNLDEECGRLAIPRVEFDIINGDTLQYRQFDGGMDFVVGNPPYVRVHNLDSNYDAVKTYTFASGGMTDLFLVFFEIGFNMLRPGGRLCYITPSSWLSSVAGGQMRDYVRHHRTLTSVIDLGHYQAFRATTYTLISAFTKGMEHTEVEYSVFDGETVAKQRVDTLDYSLFDIDRVFYFSDRATLGELREIITSQPPRHAAVKNGFATLADDVFISNTFPFDGLTIPVIKASTGTWSRAFFPYDREGKPINRDHIFGNKGVADYLNSQKQTLLKNKTEKENPNWHLYGRTQALKDVSRGKLSINVTLKDVRSIKLNRVPAGSGVYSGLYIISDIDSDIIRDILLSDDFISYITALKNYKNGGYYTFSSKELGKYLNYKIQQRIQNGRN